VDSKSFVSCRPQCEYTFLLAMEIYPGLFKKSWFKGFRRGSRETSWIDIIIHANDIDNLGK
jgi:hypothetical protein